MPKSSKKSRRLAAEQAKIEELRATSKKNTETPTSREKNNQRLTEDDIFFDSQKNSETKTDVFDAFELESILDKFTKTDELRESIMKLF